MTLDIYKVTSGFPKSEVFGLVNQMRRSAVSISSNISEGCGRKTNSDLSRLLDISIGSLNELEMQLMLSKDLNYLNSDIADALLEKLIIVRKTTFGFQKTL